MCFLQPLKKQKDSTNGLELISNSNFSCSVSQHYLKYLMKMILHFSFFCVLNEKWCGMNFVGVQLLCCIWFCVRILNSSLQWHKVLECFYIDRRFEEVVPPYLGRAFRLCISRDTYAVLMHTQTNLVLLIFIIDTKFPLSRLLIYFNLLKPTYCWWMDVSSKTKRWYESSSFALACLYSVGLWS